MHGMFITYLQALRHCTLLRYDILPFCLGSKRLILEFVTAGMIYCHLECAFREALHYIFTLTNRRLKPICTLMRVYFEKKMPPLSSIGI
jgi:hypothetical protein